MKICIHSEDTNLTIPVPDWLLGTGAALGGAAAGRYLGKVKGLEMLPKTLPKELIQEALRIKRERGSWELVRVESADGELVQIIL